MQNLSQAALPLMIAVAMTVIVVGCESPAATADPARTASTSATEPTASQTADAPRPKLLPGARTRVLDRAGDRAFDKTFDDLRFEMQLNEPFRRELLTDAITALDDQPIRIRGFILPTAQKRGLKQFVLVRDNQECCFGPGAALFDCILVEMQPGKTAEFSIRPVAVSGTFAIREFLGPDGRHLAIYHLAAESVE
jgi:hypothetical protein